MKLSKKDDLTLVEFLMSCQSSGETAEYISAYLGKSPAVAAFTAEFIRRKAAQLSGGKSVSADPVRCCCHVSGATSVSLQSHVLSDTPCARIQCVAACEVDIELASSAYGSMHSIVLWEL